MSPVDFFSWYSAPINGLLKRDKCLISLFNHIGIETGNRKESESIKFKRYPTLSVLDPDFGLKGEAFQYSFMLIIAHC